MVRNQGPRMRAGAAALAAAMSAGLMVGATTVAPQASAMAMRSDRASPEAWVAKYNARIVTLVNNRRTAHGLRPVQVAPCATSWAERWSSRLTRDDVFVHSDLGGLLDKCNATYASENIAMIYDGASPAALVRAWMSSPGHRANILSRRAKLTGVSVRWDPSQNAWVAVQNFVRK
jgi:uncharacterized protein YkwD